MSAPLTAAPKRSPRDLRVDFFRGLALVFIFIDHVPRNILANFTLNGLGFADAANVFVFLAGLAAALAYGRVAETFGMLFATARVWRRAWQLYVAHVFLFVLLTAQAAYGVRTFGNPMFYDELGISHFLAAPDVLIGEALSLHFQPTFLDILPLYIVLLLVFPLILAALRVNVLLALLPSLALYIGVQVFGFNLGKYPGGHWTFNPFAWQVLLTIGAICGHLWRSGRLWLPRWTWLTWALGIVIAAIAVIRASWTIHWAYDPFPGLLVEQLLPHLDKNNLAPLRLGYFLALTLFVVLVVPAHSRWLQSRWARPFVLCGKHSLEVFCLSVLLSVLVHVFLVEISDNTAIELAMNAFGFAAMVAIATLIDWYQRVESPARGRPQVAPAVKEGNG